MGKKIFFLITVFLIIVFLGKNLNPFSNYFFTFHDETQPARIEQFTKELKKLHFPPRIAPDMNFGVGYPLFSFYAPFSYFLTSIIHLFGISIINSLKISFLLAIIVGFFSMYKFLALFFNFYPALTGGVLYVTSLYFPLNIFIRGNLGEVWFLSLFPLGIYYLVKARKSIETDKKIFLTKIILLSFLITSHNIYSLFFIVFSIFFIIFFKKNWQNNLLDIILAILLSSYFYLPLILEMKYTWAKDVALLTNYKDHFLCVNQLWNYPWGFGGSSKGCLNDGMSFKIGKIQLILFVLGGIYTLINILKNKKRLDKSTCYSLLFFVYSFVLLFLTIYQSSFIWQALDFLKIIQFPWRLIGPSLIGIIFVAAYFLNKWPIFKKFIPAFIFIVIIILANSKYFVGQKIKNIVFEQKYLSKNYIENQVAYKVAEYLPKSNDYQFWRSLENKKNNKDQIKKLTLTPFSKEKQSNIEKISNLISLFTLLTVILAPKEILNFLIYGKRN